MGVGASAPKISGLRSNARGQVLVELDGLPWRAFPEDVAVRAGLRTGLELNRERLRRLARERRRHQALSLATRTLRHRDLSERQLADRLARAGVPAPERAEALATLGRAGYVDDARYAVEAAVLGEADAVRLQRRVDAFEERLASLERTPLSRLSRLAGRMTGT